MFAGAGVETSSIRETPGGGMVVFAAVEVTPTLARVLRCGGVAVSPEKSPEDGAGTEAS